MTKRQGDKAETIGQIVRRARRVLKLLNGGPPADRASAASPAPAPIPAAAPASGTA